MGIMRANSEALIDTPIHCGKQRILKVRAVVVIILQLRPCALLNFPNRNVVHMPNVAIHGLYSKAFKQNSPADVSIICLSLNHFDNWDHGTCLSCSF
jgi:hypothetical protein